MGLPTLLFSGVQGSLAGSLFVLLVTGLAYGKVRVRGGMEAWWNGGNGMFISCNSLAKVMENDYAAHLQRTQCSMSIISQ